MTVEIKNVQTCIPIRGKRLLIPIFRTSGHHWRIQNTIFDTETMCKAHAWSANARKDISSFRFSSHLSQIKSWKTYLVQPWAIILSSIGRCLRNMQRKACRASWKKERTPFLFTSPMRSGYQRWILRRWYNSEDSDGEDSQKYNFERDRLFGH